MVLTGIGAINERRLGKEIAIYCVFSGGFQQKLSLNC